VVTKGGSYLIEGVAVAAVLGVVAYTGLFTALGLRFRRALLWGLAYLLLWENFIANAGAGTARLSVLSYLRSLLSAYTGVGLNLADRSLPAAYVTPVLVALVAIAYTARRLARQDID
jgi:ABC-2 type transport system permease protein